MKSIALLTIAIATIALAVDGPERKPDEQLEKPAETVALKKTPIAGWGIALDLAGDCTFTPADGALKITVPGSDKPHDMSTELMSSTAPRVIQPLNGNFTIEVKIEADFDPGEVSTQAGRTGYTGAGLVVFADANNYVRLERATLSRGEAKPYTNFEIRVDGEVQRIGTTGDLPTEAGKPVWLRLQRQGNILRGFMSQDGKTWKEGEPKELLSEAWKGVPVFGGVAAISTSKKDFTPTYSGLSVQQGGK